MNDLQIFNYQNAQVRTIQRDGEPWFVLKDVCQVLNLGSPHKIAERLDDERNQIPVTDSLGRQQKTTVINESGLYAVILRSDKPEAKPFRKWVTSEVLPNIHKSLFNISKYAGCTRIFSPDEGNLTKAYFVYVEEKRRSMAKKDECRQRVERF